MCNGKTKPQSGFVSEELNLYRLILLNAPQSGFVDAPQSGFVLGCRLRIALHLSKAIDGIGSSNHF